MVVHFTWPSSPIPPHDLLCIYLFSSPVIFSLKDKHLNLIQSVFPTSCIKVTNKNLCQYKFIFSMFDILIMLTHSLDSNGLHLITINHSQSTQLWSIVPKEISLKLWYTTFHVLKKKKTIQVQLFFNFFFLCWEAYGINVYIK